MKKYNRFTMFLFIFVFIIGSNNTIFAQTLSDYHNFPIRWYNCTAKGANVNVYTNATYLSSNGYWTRTNYLDGISMWNNNTQIKTIDTDFAYSKADFYTPHPSNWPYPESVYAETVHEFDVDSYVNGTKSWIEITYSQVKFNPNVYLQSPDRTKIVTHEMGHVIGLAENPTTQDSVMTQGFYLHYAYKPTAYDKADLSKLY